MSVLYAIILRFLQLKKVVKVYDFSIFNVVHTHQMGMANI